MSGASWKGRPRVALNDMMLGEDGAILPRAAWPSTLAARTGRAISNVVVGVPAGNGQIVWLRESVLPMFSPDSASPHAVLVIFTDITAERSAYEQLRLLETKDSLTGLPNRAAFIERLDARLALPSTGESALLYIGLDHFKTVNEAMGHHMGNQVLNMAAQRIRGQAGQRALLARLGGDQLCVAIDDPNAADTLAQQVLDALARPFTGGEREVHQRPASVWRPTRKTAAMRPRWSAMPKPPCTAPRKTGATASRGIRARWKHRCCAASHSTSACGVRWRAVRCGWCISRSTHSTQANWWRLKR